MRDALTGGRGGASATIDPAVFVSDATDSTRMMMVSARLIAAAAQNRSDIEALRAEIGAIQNIRTPAELNAQSQSFQADLDVISANANDAARAQALFDRSSAQQKELLASAAFNFSLAMLINTRLVQGSDDLVRSMSSNPLQARRLLELRPVVGMVSQQASAVRSMQAPLSAILRRAGVQAPQNAEATEPRPIEL